MEISQDAKNLLLEIAHCRIFCFKEPAGDCRTILELKNGYPDRRLPIAWIGDLENAPILFISSNPTYRKEECVPSESWAEEDIIDFYVNMFNSKRRWTNGNKIRSCPLEPRLSPADTPKFKGIPFWTYISKISKEVLKTEIYPGRCWASTEIVHCPSTKQTGVEEAKKTCMSKYLDNIIKLSVAPIVILVGSHATNIISDYYNLGIAIATKNRINENHLVEKKLSEHCRDDRLFVAIPHDQCRCGRGIKYLKQYEYEKLMQWGRKALEKNRTCNRWKWIEIPVDTGKEHIKILYGDNKYPIALIAPGEGHCFRVQFLPTSLSEDERKQIVSEVRRELDFYLIELHEPDPWLYARYHTGTASNLYSKVHWCYYPEGDIGNTKATEG